MFANPFFLFIIFHAFSYFIHGYFLSVSEYEALYDLFNSTQGDKWQWRSPNSDYGYPWNFNTSNSSFSNPCSDYYPWQGIQCNSNCSSSQCYLLSLDLNTYSLRGRLPSSIGNLTNIQKLELSNNSISGTIPTELGNLKQLIKLNLQFNLRIVGSIPNSLSQLSALEDLALNDCFLHGSFPASFSNLKSLKFLYLHRNSLNGTIPAGLGYLTDLEILSLYANLFSGTIPSSFSHLASLKSLLLFHNRLHGPIPSSLGNLQNLTLLNLCETFINSTIPAELGNLTNLEFLFIAITNISGTIPPELSKLQNLKLVSLADNRLTGTIPPELGKLAKLSELNFGNNLLSGTIPYQLRELHRLNFLLLYNNSLNGSIPSDFGLLSELVQLDLSNNQLTSYIPFKLSSCANLRFLVLYQNKLNGTIPSFFSPLLKLNEIILSYNQLTGSIPESICRQKTLIYLDIAFNRLTSSIPDCIGELSVLANLLLNYNMLDKSIPDSFYDLSQLTIANFRDNQLTSTISSSLGKMHLSIFDISNNQFVGCLPDTFGMDHSHSHIPRIQNISLSLIFLNVSYNQFQCTLPSSLVNATNINFIDFSNNQFTGVVGNIFDRMQNLTCLILSNNRLSGSISHLLDGTDQVSLKYLNIRNNRFTGQLPALRTHSRFDFNQSHKHHIKMYQPNNLVIATFIADTNCFQTSIPESYCELQSLGTLILDGLRTASNCKLFIVKSIGTYGSKTAITGSIPSCIFNLPVLNTLMLSGNGIRGTLSSNITVASNLSVLSLSNNLLKGSIPSSILTKSWKSLDLSFNLFDGTLPSNMPKYQFGNSLSLEINRLSGVIPSSLFDTENIAILNGNMFECSYDRASLPVHDSKENSYQCGSNLADLSLYAYYGAFACFIAVLCFFRLFSFYKNWWNEYYSMFLQRKREWLRFFLHSDDDVNNNVNKNVSLPGNNSSSFEGFRDLYTQVMFITRLIFIMMSFIVFVGIPLYSILSTYFGTYTVQYAWVVSAVYLSGVVPTYCMLIFFMLLILLYFLCCRSSVIDKGGERTFSSYTQSRSLSIHSKTSASTQPRYSTYIMRVIQMPWRTSLVYTSVVIMNAVIVLFVNGAYVFANVSQMEFYQLILLALLVSTFKIFWSFVVVNDFFLFKSKFISSFYLGVPYKDKEKDKVKDIQEGKDRDRYAGNRTVSRSSLSSSTAAAAAASGGAVQFPISFSAAIIVFNNILAPYLAEAFVSADCFYFALFPYAPQVNSQYLYEDYACEAKSFFALTYESCKLIDSTGYSIFLPPYNYSFQCSSALITSFAYVFIFRYFLSGVIFPLYLFLLKVLQTYAVRVYGTESVLFQRLTYLLPVVLKPLVQNTPSHIIHECVSPITTFSQDAETSLSLKTLVNVVQDSSSSAPTDDNAAKGSKSHSLSQSASSNSRTAAKLMSKFYEKSGKIARHFVTNKRKGFIAILVGDLAVLMTYGALFPPLAVVVGVSIIADLHLRVALLGRLIHLALTTERELEPLIDPINREMLRVGKNLRLALPGLCFLFVFFYSFTLFDTYGDDKGAKAASWVFIVTIIAPLFFWLLLEGYKVYIKTYKVSNTNPDITDLSRRSSLLELRESIIT